MSGSKPHPKKHTPVGKSFKGEDSVSSPLLCEMTPYITQDAQRGRMALELPKHTQQANR
jgi:hypothetical protein